MHREVSISGTDKLPLQDPVHTDSVVQYRDSHGMLPLLLANFRCQAASPGHAVGIVDALIAVIAVIAVIAASAVMAVSAVIAVSKRHADRSRRSLATKENGELSWAAATYASCCARCTAASAPSG